MVLVNSFCHIPHTPRRQAGDGVGGGECRGGVCKGGGGGGANIKTPINTGFKIKARDIYSNF